MGFTSQQLRRLLLKKVISINTYCEFKILKKLQIDPCYSRQEFTLSNFTENECRHFFRFSKDELIRIKNSLKIPSVCQTKNRLVFDGTEGLCILLRRLCYPNRYGDLVKMFNRDASALSRIYNWMLSFIFKKHSRLLTTLNQQWLNQERLEEFVEACCQAGSPLPNICGFIDGTARPICRPTENQKDQYSGYKKAHCLKYQSIVFPNGLIGRLDGPFNGKRHDGAIIHLSRLMDELKVKFVQEDGTWFRLYGDPGYISSKFITVGYKNHNILTQNQKDFNAAMSSLRVSVEYGFGKILQLFAFNDFKKITNYFCSL